MKTKQLLDKISAMPEGGIVSAINRYDFFYLLSVLNSFRAQFIRDAYSKKKRLNPRWYQKHWPTWTEDAKSDCFTKFYMPAVVSLDNNSDGIRYVGTIDGDQGFMRIYSRQTLSDMQRHGVMNPGNNRNTYFLFDGNQNELEIRGKHFNTREMLTESIFSDPTAVPTFNVLMDDYPLSEDDIPAVEQMIFSANTRIVETTAPMQAFTGGQVPKK